MSHTDAFTAFQTRRAEEKAAARQAARDAARAPRAEKSTVLRAAPAPDEAALKNAKDAANAARAQLESTKRSFGNGSATYDDLAHAGRTYSEALYQYAKIKSPAHARRIPYQDVIR